MVTINTTTTTKITTMAIMVPEEIEPFLASGGAGVAAVRKQ